MWCLLDVFNRIILPELAAGWGVVRRGVMGRERRASSLLQGTGASCRAWCAVCTGACCCGGGSAHSPFWGGCSCLQPCFGERRGNQWLLHP